jgi:hypothetical protein
LRGQCEVRGLSCFARSLTSSDEGASGRLVCFIALLCLLLSRCFSIVTRGVGYSSSLLDTNIRIKYNAVRRIMVENGEKDLSLVVDLELFPILFNVY